MLLNHNRKTAQEAPVGEESFCPDCKSVLIGKRGDIIIWHWAHKSLEHSTLGCRGGETLWHLTMKDYVRSWPGWEIEFPIIVDGQSFRLDAYEPSTGRVIEFVHTLSPHYEEKNRLLVKSGKKVMWIADGDALGSKRATVEDRTGCRMRGLLKPLADWQHMALNLTVLHGNVFWRETENEIWTVISDEICDRLRIHHVNA